MGWWGLKLNKGREKTEERHRLKRLIAGKEVDEGRGKKKGGGEKGKRESEGKTLVT